MTPNTDFSLFKKDEMKGKKLQWITQFNTTTTLPLNKTQTSSLGLLLNKIKLQKIKSIKFKVKSIEHLATSTTGVISIEATLRENSYEDNT